MQACAKGKAPQMLMGIGCERAFVLGTLPGLGTCLLGAPGSLQGNTLQDKGQSPD